MKDHRETQQMQGSVGVFWVYRHQIFFRSVPIGAVTPVGHFIDSDLAHYEVWDRIAKEHKDFYLYEYEEIPRGRVVYDISSDHFVVYAHKSILHSDDARRLIVEAFCLGGSTVVFEYDAHYEIG